MSDFELKKCLPSELVIDSVDNHLYRIGLCLTTQHTIKRRKFIYKPIIIFIVLWIHIIKSISDILIEDNHWAVYLGTHYTRLLDIKIHFNIAFIFFIGISISSQIIWFNNYKNNIKPKFLKVFQMMSGFITPVSIGLTNHKQIIELIKRTRILFKIIRFNIDVVISIIGIFFCWIPYFLKCSLFETLIFGIPNSVLFTLLIHYCWNTILYHGIYSLLLFENKIRKYRKNHIKNENKYKKYYLFHI